MDFDATERDIVTPTVSTTLHGSTPMGNTEKRCGQNADRTTFRTDDGGCEVYEVVDVWLSEISSPIETITL